MLASSALPRVCTLGCGRVYTAGTGVRVYVVWAVGGVYTAGRYGCVFTRRDRKTDRPLGLKM